MATKWCNSYLRLICKLLTLFSALNEQTDLINVNMDVNKVNNIVNLLPQN